MKGPALRPACLCCFLSIRLLTLVQSLVASETRVPMSHEASQAPPQTSHSFRLCGPGLGTRISTSPSGSPALLMGQDTYLNWLPMGGCIRERIWGGLSLWHTDIVSLKCRARWWALIPLGTSEHDFVIAAQSLGPYSLIGVMGEGRITS